MGSWVKEYNKKKKKKKGFLRWMEAWCCDFERDKRVRIEKSCGCAVIESAKGAYRQKS